MPTPCCYVFWETEVSGTGTAEIEVAAGPLVVATGLVVELEPGRGGPADVNEVERAGLPASLEIFPSVVEQGRRAVLRFSGGGTVVAFSIHSVDGGLVDSREVRCSGTDCSYEWTAAGVPSGVYFAKATVDGGSSATAKIVGVSR